MQKTKRGWWLTIWLLALAACSSFSSRALATTCEVGDLSKGYWKMVGAPYQGKCIIPGPPHPDSPFLHSRSANGAFRIEGKYKVVTVLTGKGFYVGCPECVPSCITGFAEWGCTGVYGNGFTYEPNGQLCMMPDGNKNGVPDGCACFTDGNAVTLYEWAWTNKDCEKEDSATPNLDSGKPDCPQVPLN